MSLSLKKATFAAMSKKKDLEPDSAAEELIWHILDNLGNMSEEERDMAMRMLTGHGSENSNEPDDLNAHYYAYEGPKQYNTGAKRVPRWLKKMWDANDYDSWLQLCEDTGEAGRELTDAKKSQDVRKYVYMLIDDFYDGGCYPEQNPIKLIGPLWLIEHYRLTDCLDLVLEVLRQEAWFYTAYIDHAPQCLSAVLYQIGSDRADLLRDLLYEQGLIPLIKPIVFNALIWIAVRQPQKRIAMVAIMTAYLNHCLDICKKGASARNISNYALALAYFHIDEARPILRRLFNEVKGLDKKELEEVEDIYDDPTDQTEGKLFDSIDGYLRYYKEDTDEWEDEYYDEEEDEEVEEAGIFDRWKLRKRYTVRVELTDAPEPVERTLQVPSNIRLNALAQLIMVAFGRKDEPAEYHYMMKDTMYTEGVSNGFTLSDMLKKKNQTALFNVYDRRNGAHWRHGIVLEKSAEYSDRTTNYIALLDGRGTYPPASTPDMDAYLQRYNDGKLHKPNFMAVRRNIREFEEHNGLPF